jgi:hypothetical protein
MHLRSVVTGALSTGITLMAVLNSTVGLTIVVATFFLLVLILFTVTGVEIEDDNRRRRRIRRVSVVRRSWRRTKRR